MTAPTPRLTIAVVMAVRDGARFIADALDSVAAQTRAPDEVIVVDGGSRDESVAIAERYARVTVISQRGDGGFAGAWDEGIAHARSDAITLLDSDDVWAPDKLARQAGVLERSPETDYVVGNVVHFLQPGVALPAGLRPEILDVERLALMPGAVMVRRSALARVGPWSGGYTITADIDWFARAKDILGPPAVIDAPVIRKRMHDSNVSLFAAEAYNTEILALLRASVARQS